MRDLANALTPPPNGRRGRTPLDERDGLPVVHSVRCITPDLQMFREPILDSYTTQSVKQHYSEAIEELGTVKACIRQKREENDGELWVTYWNEKKCRGRQ